MRSRLAKLIKPDTDSIRFYFLCQCCQGKVERIGGEPVRDNTIFFA
ncbi:CRISPR-associated protein Cas2 [Richelia sinica FACHB-800]|uniref:CRISPR-associated protein Cas2 n=2 Tax=Richelia TaxID=98443 RepID=A0A975Y670_9NOST|nr:CRISPR-associated protein Cas2 [Richelia sinica FACHB-800]